MSMNEQNGIITLMRGDSFSFVFPINMGTALSPVYRQLQESDVLYLGVMEPNQAFEDAVLKQRYDYSSDKTDEGDVIITIKPHDTANLLVGKYYYMIKLRYTDEFGNDAVKTLVKPTLFWLEGNNPESLSNTVEKFTATIDRLVFDGGEIL